MPETSVIVRTYNEARLLPRLLEALDRQSYRDFEIVVVDSGSVDGTCELAGARAEKLVRIQQSDFTFGHSLNAGIKEASGRFLAIISAHASPVDGEWLGALVAPLREPGTAMVYGRQVGDESSKYGERLDFDRVFGPRPRRLKPPHFFANNANSAVRRDLWDAHPFDEALPGLEDIEWAKHHMEQGLDVVYEPRASVYHTHQETWAQVRRRYYREGQAAKWIGLLGRRDAPGQVAREAAWLLGDLTEAARSGQLGARLEEIARFRWEKALGTVTGIWDGAGTGAPTWKRAVFDRPYKALVIRGPGRAAVEDVELRDPRPSEVLVRVAYQGVCATDLEVFEGTLGYFESGRSSFPIVPGHEFSGTVAAVGARAGDLKPGDRVVVECIQGCGGCAPCRGDNAIGCDGRSEVGVMGRDGGYSEFVLTPLRSVHRIPAGLPLKSAALCEPLAVVLKGLRRLEAAWGPGAGPRDCAVVGAGTIGHLTARVLASRGHRVTVYDRAPSRLDAVCDGAIARGGAELARHEVLVEATGSPDALEAILHRSPPGCSILLLGLPYARREFTFESIVAYDKTIVGSVGSASRDYVQALGLLPRLDVTALTSALFPLERYADAWSALKERSVLKAMLEICPEAPVQRAAAVARVEAAG